MKLIKAYKKLKDTQEQQNFINLKQKALNLYMSWILSEPEYEQQIAQIEIYEQQYKLNQNKTTPWTIATDATTGLFTWTVNLILWNSSPFKKK